MLTDGNPNDSAPMPPASAKMTRSGYGTFSTRSGNTFESRSDHGNNSAGQDGNTARDDKSDGSFFGLIGGGNREYQGPAAVQDTADSVKKLRDSGIRTAAIFSAQPITSKACMQFMVRITYESRRSRS